jgi:GNAT superfamily N-acetyltransferase
MADVSVRPARDSDAADLAALQVAAWRAGYAGVLPPATLDALAGQHDAFAAAWAEATVRPPTFRHRVLVACDGPTIVAGATLGPAEDDDRDPGTHAEVFTFLVDPSHRRHGHGSRLLSASVDFLRGAAFTAVTIWLDGQDGAARALFTSAGWVEDGSTRLLDLDGDGSVVVEQVRLHTDLTEGLGP